MKLLHSPASASRKARPATGPITAGHQRGVAIITALLIVTIAATISINISTRLQLDVRRTSNMIAQDQAEFYLYAAESWSQRILREDKKKTKTDDYSEEWAFELPPIPVPGGTIQGRLFDLHSCLNINSLLATGAVDPTMDARINQLFKNLNLRNKSTQAIIDWIDADLNTTSPDGAEDVYYMNLDRPYRTANRQLQSISEIRMIKGFENGNDYIQLLDHVCAFATGSATTINVNTATAEVLKSLSPSMTDALAKDIVEYRVDNPFKDLKDFTSFSNVGTIITKTDSLSVSSDYFLLRTQAIIGQANKIMYSIIYRDGSGKTQVISRSYRTL